jgi:two-component system, NarL family, response regulator DesR
MIRVLLAEDQALVRGAMAAQPDVALLDFELPGGDGLTAATALRQAVPSCRVLIVTTFGRGGYLRRAMASGAVGFLLTDAPAAELASAMRRVMADERVVDPALALAALGDGDNPLTPREQEVLTAARGGATVGEMAANLALSEGTVRHYLLLAIQKLGVRNRVEAARVADEKGWL